MKKEIIINSTVNEVRAAIKEDNSLAEYFIEFPDQQRIIGNIYYGKVTNIIQGINAAFIDIGFKNDAFLHFSDVDESLERTVIIDEDESEEQPELVDESLAKAAAPEDKIEKKVSDVALRKSLPTHKLKDQPKFYTKRVGDVHLNLAPGMEVLVQITREAYSTKGVKCTSKIAIPGKYLVLLPFDKLLGVSRKIASIQERKRLRQNMRNLNLDNFGCIIRTAAKGKTKEELKTDWEYLKKTWSDIVEKVDSTSPPSLVYSDMTLSKSIARDLFDHKTEKLWVDSKKLYNEIKSYVEHFSPKLLGRVRHYDNSLPIFDHFGLARDIDNIYRREVYLQGSGSIVFDQTEAMMVIDVNSGRSNNKDQERMAFNLNMNALSEICKQLRLRDIGGMIVIDFIDMMHESNRKKLFNQFKNEMSRDRAKWVVYPLTQLGLLQITRQRINQNIAEKVTEICPTCEGSGKIPTSGFTLNRIENWLKSFKSQSREFRLLLKVHPTIANELIKGTISKLSKLMFRYFVRIKVLQDEELGLNDFKFFSVRNQKEITREY